MEKYRAIPRGFMSVGEIAKKMGITVRTLQYYDKKGLLPPSAESEGGRRLYTDKDLITLYQILSLKHLGFSLDDIKICLTSLDAPTDVARVLTAQAVDIQREIETLSESLREIELLKAEVLQMQTVDWKKYADIIINLQMNNEFYSLIKHFDNDTLDHLRSRFDKESGMEIINTMHHLFEKIADLQKNDILPESELGQQVAKKWWNMVLAFTGGDMSQLPGLMELAKSKGRSDEKWTKKWTSVEPYITKALEAYFANLDVNPLEGVNL